MLVLRPWRCCISGSVGLVPEIGSDWEVYWCLQRVPLRKAVPGAILSAVADSQAHDTRQVALSSHQTLTGWNPYFFPDFLRFTLFQIISDLFPEQRASQRAVFSVFRNSPLLAVLSILARNVVCSWDECPHRSDLCTWPVLEHLRQSETSVSIKAFWDSRFVAVLL